MAAVMSGRRAGWVAVAALSFAALTAFVFLVRAGDAGPANWPITWELRSSDNGVLFQFAADVFAGRPLDWSFSPQVFVFPEIPISLVAYAVAGGTVQLYYLVVAVLNNTLLFLVLVLLVDVLYPRDELRTRLARAAIASLPLLVLPLIGTTWLLSYPLAPTYYFGMYLAILVAPVFLVAERLWVRVAVGAALALTGASNPLMFVFVLPALVLVLLTRGLASGWRPVARPAAWSAAVLLVAFVLRIALFGRLQGGSPLAYIDSGIFSGRVTTIRFYFAALFADPVTATILVIGVVGALGGLLVAVLLGVRAIRRRNVGARELASVYLGAVPLGGLVGTIILIITDYLYFWPVVILPIVLLLLPLPRAGVRWILPAAAVGLAVTLVANGGVTAAVASSAYFSYRSAETQCLDAKLPAGVTVGYATFSDARRLELTSDRGFRLIQLKSSGVRAYWLTNRDYARDDVGRFFYLNEHGDEPAISRSYIEGHFGPPDRQFTCSPGQTVIIYDAPAKLALIKARYATLPAPAR